MPIKNAPDYDFIQLYEAPAKILERTVFVKSIANQRDVFIKGRAESKRDFFKRMSKASTLQLVVPNLSNPTIQKSFGELLFEDAIECVKDYECRSINNSLPTQRISTNFP